MLDQSKTFFSFSRQVRKLLKHREYDLVFATSSRLMTAVLGAWIARRKKAKLYLDIRDIFVDTIKDVLPPRAALVARPFFSNFERYAISRANKVNLVSEGFRSYFQSRYPHQGFSYFTNGIDEEFISTSTPSRTHPAPNAPINVLYAGNMGEGQGLHAIIPELAKQMAGVVQFTLIGDGGRKPLLESRLNDFGCNNVELLPPMGREQLIQSYRSADVLFLHLNDYQAFRKVLPSKIFEYAAVGKPIWAGVSGYAAEFINREIENASVFPPCDAEAGENAFKSLQLTTTMRDKFTQRFLRSTIMNDIVNDMLRLVE